MPNCSFHVQNISTNFMTKIKFRRYFTKLNADLFNSKLFRKSDPSRDVEIFVKTNKMVLEFWSIVMVTKCKCFQSRGVTVATDRLKWIRRSAMNVVFKFKTVQFIEKKEQDNDIVVISRTSSFRGVTGEFINSVEGWLSGECGRQAVDAGGRWRCH